MVPDLVPEMAEQAAIGLGQFRPALLDLGAVGLRKRDRHHAVVVPGHDFGTGRVGGIGQEFEHQTVARILGPGLQRQVPAKQAIEQPVLRELDVSPCREMRGLRNVGNRVVVAARHTKPVLSFCGREPVADVVVRVGAETALPALSHQRRPGFAARGLKRRHDFEFRDIAKPMAATAAGSIFEIDDVVANLTAKQFHRKQSSASDEAPGTREASNRSHRIQTALKIRLGGRVFCCEKEASRREPGPIGVEQCG